MHSVPSLSQPRGRLADASSALAAARPHSLRDAARTAPLLGYDWVAAMLEADGGALDAHDDAYFEDLAAFRRVHRTACEAPRGLLDADPVFDRITDALAAAESGGQGAAGRRGRAGEGGLPPQPGFRIDDRLFPQPVPVEQDPTLEVRGADLSRFVRISLPRTRLRDLPPQQPRRREAAGDAQRALGLSRQCVRGYESARPSAPAARPAVDLRSSLRAQTVDERWPYGMEPPPREDW